MLGFDDYPDIAARLRSIVAGEAHHAAHPAGPAPAAADLAGRARRCPPTPVPGHALRPRVRCDAGSTRARRLRSSWPAAATAAAPSARSPPSAARSSAAGPRDVLQEARWLAEQGVQRALPGQRELHVLRQGPRRPAAARDAAARAGRRRRRRAGAGVLPPARRDPARADRGDRERRRASTPYFDLSFQHASADVLRRMRRFGDPESFLGLLEQVRALAPARRRAQQRDRRLPRRDRGRPARPCATSWSPPGWTSPASSATPTRTAPRRRRTTASSTRTRSAPGSSTSATWSRSSPPSGRPSGSARRSRCWSSGSSDGEVEGRAAHQGPEVDGSTYLLDERPPQVGDLVRAVVVDVRGRRPLRPGARDDRRGQQAPAQQLERPQRADHAADRAGAVLRLGAADRRRRLDHLALRRVRRSSRSR